MPPLSISNVTIKELFKRSAKFGRPSRKQGAGWIVTADKGNAIIQKQTNKDGTIVFVARWTNYMGADGLNGRILPGLPIHRAHDSVYFKTSSTTTLGNRYKAPFCFKFETVDDAEEFEAFWLLKNGSIALWKEQDAKKKESSNSKSNNLPLIDTTNNVASSTPLSKRKASPMNDGPLLKKVKGRNDSLNLVCIDDKKNNGDENVPPSLSERRTTCVVGAFKAARLMPTESKINGEVRKIVKVKRSALKSIEEGSTLTNLNEDEDGNDIKDDDNSKDSNEDDDGSSNDSSGGEDVIIDEEDAPQSQNWKTAFASYD